MGLSVGGLIRGGGGGGEGWYMRIIKRASETTDIIRQNEHLFLKKMKKMYRIIRLFTH